VSAPHVAPALRPLRPLELGGASGRRHPTRGVGCSSSGGLEWLFEGPLPLWAAPRSCRSSDGGAVSGGGAGVGHPLEPAFKMQPGLPNPFVEAARPSLPLPADLASAARRSSSGGASAGAGAGAGTAGDGAAAAAGSWGGATAEARRVLAHLSTQLLLQFGPLSPGEAATSSDCSLGRPLSLLSLDSLGSLRQSLFSGLDAMALPPAGPADVPEPGEAPSGAAGAAQPAGPAQAGGGAAGSLQPHPHSLSELANELRAQLQAGVAWQQRQAQQARHEQQAHAQQHHHRPHHHNHHRPQEHQGQPSVLPQAHSAEAPAAAPHPWPWGQRVAAAPADQQPGLQGLGPRLPPQHEALPGQQRWRQGGLLPDMLAAMLCSSRAAEEEAGWDRGAQGSSANGCGGPDDGVAVVAPTYTAGSMAHELAELSRKAAAGGGAASSVWPGPAARGGGEAPLGVGTIAALHHIKGICAALIRDLDGGASSAGGSSSGSRQTGEPAARLPYGTPATAAPGLGIALLRPGRGGKAGGADGAESGGGAPRPGLPDAGAPAAAASVEDGAAQGCAPLGAASRERVREIAEGCSALIHRLSPGGAAVPLSTRLRLQPRHQRLLWALQVAQHGAQAGAASGAAAGAEAATAAEARVAALASAALSEASGVAMLYEGEGQGGGDPQPLLSWSQRPPAAQRQEQPAGAGDAQQPAIGRACKRPRWERACCCACLAAACHCSTVSPTQLL
jgi:hypothetical protein